jgi:hypothetical protein
MMQPRVWRSSRDGRYYAQARQQVFEAKLISPGDVAEIEAATVLDEVLGLAGPQYRLRQACRPVRLDTLTARVDVATKLAGVEKVPPLVEAELSSEAYTAIDLELWKNVVHIAVSDEAVKRAAHDIISLHAADAARDLARMENKQIAEELAKATEDAATDTWDTFMGGVSDANPFADIQAQFEVIEGAGYPPDCVVMHPQVWSGFITNTYVAPLVEAGIVGAGAAGASLSLPGWPTVKVLIDHAVTPDTGCFVLSVDAPAVVLGEGPTEAARYRDERAGYDAYIIRQWLQPVLVLGDAIREITGAHS